MTPFNPLAGLICLLIALFTAAMLAKKFGKPLVHDRYVSLDGLRGYCAFFVFLHHASIWYSYLRTNSWVVPPSRLYTHLGQSSVAMFFMITGFLFFSKLLDAKIAPIDWRKLFISRLLRLAPLYLFAMCLLFLTIAIVSDWELKEPVLKLAGHLIKWLAFTAFGTADINSHSDTFVIVAGVTWTLPYEWFFYLSLPLLSMLIRNGARPPRSFLLLSTITTLIAAFQFGGRLQIWMYFVGGIIAAFLIRHETFRQLATKPLAAIITIGCVSGAVILFPTAFTFPAWLLLSISFIPIACGNTLFGLLIMPASRMLGEMTYSIYLLHGLLLFWSFNFILRVQNAASCSPTEHWLYIITLTPILVVSSFITFSLIENPAMNLAKNWKPRF